MVLVFYVEGSIVGAKEQKERCMGRDLERIRHQLDYGLMSRISALSNVRQ